MKTLPDWQIESELALVHFEMCISEITSERMKYLMQKQKELIAMRSPEAVAQMEREKGLV